MAFPGTSERIERLSVIISETSGLPFNECWPPYGLTVLSYSRSALTNVLVIAKPVRGWSAIRKLSRNGLLGSANHVFQGAYKSQLAMAESSVCDRIAFA